MFEKLIDNKPAVFLALAFSNLMKVNVSIATDEMNIDAFNYFLDELSSEYIECVDTSYIPAKHLLDSSYFIKPAKSDIQIYNDIINACQPVYLYKDQVLATLYDNTVAVSLINNKKKLDRDIKDIIRNLKDRGIGVLITDHNVRETLAICERAYIVSEGAVIAEGTPQEVLENETVREVYLGEDFTV